MILMIILILIILGLGDEDDDSGGAVIEEAYSHVVLRDERVLGTCCTMI